MCALHDGLQVICGAEMRLGTVREDRGDSLGVFSMWMRAGRVLEDGVRASSAEPRREFKND